MAKDILTESSKERERQMNKIAQTLHNYIHTLSDMGYHLDESEGMLVIKDSQAKDDKGEHKIVFKLISKRK